jgi:hypothetical protein
MKEEEHLGQLVTESAIARLKTGMAKKRMIKIIMIHSENFFFFFIS